MDQLPPIDRITLADIQRLIDEQEPEGPRLDYKERLSIKDRASREKLCKHVSGLANASGGWLVFGLQEHRDEENNANGFPRAIVDPAPGKNDDDLVKDANNVVRDGITPRVNTSMAVATSGDERVLVIHVPPSFSAPHMVNHAGSRFYVRTNRSTEPMDINQIRDAFTRADREAERVRSWRHERLSRIRHGETPVRVVGDSRLVVHVFPLSAPSISLLDHRIVLSASGSSSFKPLMFHTGTFGAFFNLDGVCWHDSSTEYAGSGYVLVFRQGMLESVDGLLLSSKDKTDDTGILFLEELAREVRSALKTYGEALARFELLGPTYVGISLLGVRGFREGEGFRRKYSTPIDRDDLVLPGIIVEDPRDTWHADQLRPLFDALWQSAGVARCPLYDDNGKWQPRG